jgi:hypothetical protein
MNRIRLDATGMIAGLVFIAIGGLLVLDRLDVWAVDYRYVWPGVLIALGGAVLLRAMMRGRG